MQRKNPLLFLINQKRSVLKFLNLDDLYLYHEFILYSLMLLIIIIMLIFHSNKRIYIHQYFLTCQHLSENYGEKQQNITLYYIPGNIKFFKKVPL